jgi:hypothetical protein
MPEVNHLAEIAFKKNHHPAPDLCCWNRHELSCSVLNEFRPPCKRALPRIERVKNQTLIANCVV